MLATRSANDPQGRRWRARWERGHELARAVEERRVSRGDVSRRGRRVGRRPGLVLDPNPHAGHEGGEHLSLGDFLQRASAHDVIRGILGDGALDEILAEVRRRLG